MSGGWLDMSWRNCMNWFQTLECESDINTNWVSSTYPCSQLRKWQILKSPKRIDEWGIVGHELEELCEVIPDLGMWIWHQHQLVVIYIPLLSVEEMTDSKISQEDWWVRDGWTWVGGVVCSDSRPWNIISTFTAAVGYLHTLAVSWANDRF